MPRGVYKRKKKVAKVKVKSVKRNSPKVKNWGAVWDEPRQFEEASVVGGFDDRVRSGIPLFSAIHPTAMPPEPKPFNPDSLFVKPPLHDSPISPAHYQRHPSGVECITITEHFNFNRGNAIKYIWRADEKGSTLENLRKAQWYLNREIERLEKEAVK